MSAASQSQPIIRIGVIGLGHWGPNHVRIFSSLPESRVVAVADTDQTRRERIAASTPGVQTLARADTLVALPEVDAVVVATPTSTHYAVVKAALEAGKHVLCEKPLCTSSAEGEELAALARAKNRVLMVGHIFLFNSSLQKVKELMDAGEIGDIRYISATRTNLGPVRNDINAAWDLASHDIAVFNWLLGSEPVEVQAMGASFLQPGIEDVVNINMKYPGNVLTSIQCSWLDPKKVRQMTIVGSKRMITWDDLSLSNPVAIYEKTVQTNMEIGDYGEFLRLSMLDGDVHLPRIHATEPLKVQASAFIKAVQTGDIPHSDSKCGVAVVRTLEKIDASLNSRAKS